MSEDIASRGRQPGVLRRIRQASRLIEVATLHGAPNREKTDAPRERLTALLHRLLQEFGITDQEALGPFAKRQVDERGILPANGQEIGRHADHALPWTRILLLQQSQYLAHAGAEPLMAPLQPFQHFNPARQAAPF